MKFTRKKGLGESEEKSKSQNKNGNGNIYLKERNNSSEIQNGSFKSKS